MADYGFAPYHESAFKKALRLAALGVPGLSAVPQGANFGEAFLAAAGGGARAAQAYAQRQAEAQRQAQQDALHNRFLEAEISQMSRPPKVEKHVPTAAEKVAELEAAKGGPLTPEEKARALGYYVQPPRSALPKGLKPKEPAPRKATSKEQQLIDAIQLANPSDPAHRDRLNQIIENQTSPLVRKAAMLKLLNHMTIRTTP